MSYTIRPLTSVDDFVRVFELERRVWALPSGDDAVPVNVFVATVKCGAILLGAFDEDDSLAGFVYSFPGLRHGRLLQWSHMLGVDEPHRAHGLGRRLKLAQRELALAHGVTRIEWTFDPLQVENAHLNLGVLGASASEYLEDVYGPSDSPLHAGTPTDRLVAGWDLDSDEVRQLCDELATGPRPARPASGRVDALPVNRVRREERWVVCDGEPDLTCEAPALEVLIPPAFTGMLREVPARAREWRLQTREVFRTYVARGYVATAFGRHDDGGRYVLTLPSPAAR
jgi:predicted GNAT superfamily acetyltransferase